MSIGSKTGNSLGEDVSTLASAIGINLLPWQVLVADSFTQIDDSGRFANELCALSVPRQNGKSFLVIAICVYLMLVKKMRIAYTAHNYSTVCDIFDRFKRLFGVKANDQNAPIRELNDLVKNVRGTTSRECIELKPSYIDGFMREPCIAFSTRTDSSQEGNRSMCLS